VTGQAAWYDVRVRIYPADEAGVFPEFPVLSAVPGMRKERKKWLAYVAGKDVGE
jgi:hypothetical protein